MHFLLHHLARRGLRADGKSVGRTFRMLRKQPRTLTAVALALITGAAVVLFSLSSANARQAQVETLRWVESAPNCTLRISDDGHNYYTLSLDDLEVTLALDRQEFEKISHRQFSMVALSLTFQYSGKADLPISQQKLTLEFVNHRQVLQPALDPGGLVVQLQDDEDELTDEVENHQIRKHPEQKEQKEAELHTRLHDYKELIDFIGAHALASTTLNEENRSASGWVFFSTQNPWVGHLRAPEHFVLRLAAGSRQVEFPFELPPKAAKVQLRRRPGS